MKLKNKVVSAMKDARVYGLPGDEVVLVSDADQHKLSNPRAVLVVKHVHGRGKPFPVKIEDLVLDDLITTEELTDKEQKPAQDQQTLFG